MYSPTNYIFIDDLLKGFTAYKGDCFILLTKYRSGCKTQKLEILNSTRSCTLCRKSRPKLNVKGLMSNTTDGNVHE